MAVSRGPAGKDWGAAYAPAVIKRLGGKVTPEKLKFFQAWAQAEGTEAAYNPFATTRKGFPGETNFNSVGVKNYRDARQGINATVDTLKLGYYTELVNLIRDPNATAEDLGKAVAASPWGTGTGVLRVLGSSLADGYEKQNSTAKYGAQKVQLEQQYSNITADPFRPVGSSDRFAPTQSYTQMMQKLNPALGRLSASYEPLDALVPQKPADDLAAASLNSPGVGGDVGFNPNQPVIYQGEKMILPTSWKSTHQTSGMEDEGYSGAIDIMGDAGKPVGAPEGGTIVYYHPTGAQGGGSMLLRTKSGRQYWIGHIQSDLKAGTKVKRGQTIAAISADHPRPHVHIDRRG